MPYTVSHVLKRKPTRPPKKWFYAKVKEVKRGNPSYTVTMVKATVGNIWKKLSPSMKIKILKREGKLIQGTSSKGVQLMARKKKKRSRFRKGSAAAKRFMSRLRSMQRPRRKTRKTRKSRKKVRRFSEALEPLIIREGSVGMARKRRRSRKTVSRKRRTTRRRYSGGLEGRRRRSRRRYSGSALRFNPVDVAMKSIGMGAGMVAGSAVAKMVPIKDPRLKALVPILLGIVMSSMRFARGRIMESVATGSTAIGVVSLVKQFVPQVPLLAGANSAQDIINAVNQLPDEEKAMLGFSGYLTTAGQDSGTEVLVGQDNQSPLTV